ncbi:MAG: STAS domain-containing protein [Candidatus Poribacteria bacterium]|nr:STAS domain-containing protein [Candidatus Poribacteria bacterium]
MFETTMSQYNTPILRANGKIIGNAVEALRREMRTQIEQGGRHLILDLTDVPLLDSSALGAIIATLQALKKSDGKLVLLNPQEAVLNVLAVTRLDTVLEIYRDEADAVNAFSQG